MTSWFRCMGAWGAALAGTAAMAAPTTECSSQPWMVLVDIYGPAPSLVADVQAAIADPASNPGLLDRLGDPVSATFRAAPTPYSSDLLQLRYDPAQDTREIATSLGHDATLAGQFGSVMPDGYSVCFATSPPPQPVTLTEYHNTRLDHYFISSSDAENASIDGGGAGPGWARTGQQWKTYAPSACAGTSKAVYRFYGTPGIGPNSHFFTADATECGGLRHGTGWTYEGMAFGAELPVNGQCPVNAPRPVYRAYNNRWMYNDSNHRYATDPAIYAGMIAKGWIGEGVALCLPSIP